MKLQRRYYPVGLKNGVYRIITSTIASGPDENSGDTGVLRLARLPGKETERSKLKNEHTTNHARNILWS